MTVPANVPTKEPRLGRHAVIIGGGISGLSAAFFLSRKTAREHRPLKITLFEASDRFGGVLRTLSHSGVHMEAGADAFYAGREDAADLCRELGLQEDMIEAAPCFRHFFRLQDKKVFPVPGLPGSLFDAARSLRDPRLSLSVKRRMLWEPFVPRRREAGDESVANFFCRRLGQDFYRKVVRPLVRSVYMMDPEGASMEVLFPGLQQAERIFGSLTGSFLRKRFKKNEQGPAEFLTLKQGLEGLVRALVRESGDCELRRSAPVRECVYHDGWEVFPEEGPAVRADILCLAMNSRDSSKLLSRTAPGLSRMLSALRYDPIATVNLIYTAGDMPAGVPGPGFLAPMDGERYPFSSLKWLGKSADGKYLLLRAFLSEAMVPEVFSESDETLRQKIPAFLNDHFSCQARPLFVEVERYPDGLPQYGTGHFERMAQIEKTRLQHPGLFLIGNGFRGFGISDCIRLARTTVDLFPV